MFYGIQVLIAQDNVPRDSWVYSGSILLACHIDVVEYKKSFYSFVPHHSQGLVVMLARMGIIHYLLILLNEVTSILSLFRVQDYTVVHGAILLYKP
jgi:formate hydrogenlyase subunit 4